jgi:MFS family permease
VLAIGRNPGELETGLTVIVYAVMANLCYTLGWIVDLAGRKFQNLSDRGRAKKLLVAGLCFSCLLTSAPFWFELVFFLVHEKN